MDSLETDYLEKAAMARRIKARIFSPPIAAANRPTGALSITHRIHTHLLPGTLSPAGGRVTSRADDGLDGPCEDAA